MDTITQEGAFTSDVRLKINSNFALVPTVTSSTSAPDTTPGKIGDIHVKTDTAKVYMATGTSSSSDWTLLN